MAYRGIPTMDMLELIRLIRAGESDRQIARLLGHNRRTVIRDCHRATEQGFLAGELPTLAALQRLVRETLPPPVPPQQTSSAAFFAEETDSRREWCSSSWSERRPLSGSGDSAWRTREPSVRAREDVVFTGQIERIHRASRATYGAPRIHAELAADGVRCGRRQVARLMWTPSLVGCHRRPAPRTTQRAPAKGQRPIESVDG